MVEKKTATSHKFCAVCASHMSQCGHSVFCCHQPQRFCAAVECNDTQLFGRVQQHDDDEMPPLGLPRPALQPHCCCPPSLLLRHHRRQALPLLPLTLATAAITAAPCRLTPIRPGGQRSTWQCGRQQIHTCPTPIQSSSLQLLERTSNRSLAFLQWPVKLARWARKMSRCLRTA